MGEGLEYSKEVRSKPRSVAREEARKAGGLGILRQLPAPCCRASHHQVPWPLRGSARKPGKPAVAPHCLASQFSPPGVVLQGSPWSSFFFLLKPDLPASHPTFCSNQLEPLIFPQNCLAFAHPGSSFHRDIQSPERDQGHTAG